ncbi:uncharacterized protein LOC133304498 [Gastrolobium bilobum]|uniref:uncharacterized protein LOC133304498 n=1 Tax=Gastrolobium bilobum TaxID=150636 RepID=UPI002AAF4274|nr:uncharacterized protein LOC133304498 [Gastrolobium bilobum]
MNMDHKNSRPVCTTSHDSNVGLVCHYQFENGSSQFVFLDVENGSGAVLDHSLSFFTENFVQTLASSNGLILLSGYSGDHSCYYVLNPLTKNSVMIPQTCIDGCVVRVGLAFDGCQFEVVLVEAGSSKSNGLEFHIFSSDTGKWRRHPAINLTIPSLPEFEFQELGTPPLYSNGAIHWEIGGYLLVYQVKGSHCELYELPNLFEDWSWQSTMTRRCLCESGDRVYYCYTDLDGFHIWDLLKDHDHLRFFCASNDPKKFRWRLVHTVNHEVFMSKHQNFFYGNLCDWEPYKITPIAYSEQAQTIYLQLPGTVVSYNFDTGNLRSICTYSYPGINFDCFSFLPSTTFGLPNAQKERDMLTNGETELNLPIAEIEKLAL